MDFFKVIFDVIKNIFVSYINIIVAVFSAFMALFRGDWEALWAAVKDIFQNIWEVIKNIFNAAVEFILLILSVLFGQSVDDVRNWFMRIKNWFTQAADFIRDTVNRIVRFFQPFLDIIDRVTNFVGGGLGRAANMIGGLLNNNRENIKDIGAATGYFTRGGQAVGDMVSDIITYYTDTTNINFNVQNNNKFEGERAAQRRAHHAITQATGYATDEFARALRYAR